MVLVGHALHHDLQALRLDYLPVIDTSLLLSYKCGHRSHASHAISRSAALLQAQNDVLLLRLPCVLHCTVLKIHRPPCQPVLVSGIGP